MAAAVAVPAISFATPAGIRAQAENVFRPEDYGAVVNDGKDDRQAIKDAADAAGKAGGGVVEFASGQYDFGLYVS